MWSYLSLHFTLCHWRKSLFPTNFQPMALPTHSRVIVDTTIGDVKIELWSKVHVFFDTEMPKLTPMTCRKHPKHVGISSRWPWRVCEFLARWISQVNLQKWVGYYDSVIFHWLAGFCLLEGWHFIDKSVKGCARIPSSNETKLGLGVEESRSMVVREFSVIFDSEFMNMQNHLRTRSTLDYDSLTEALWGWWTMGWRIWTTHSSLSHLVGGDVPLPPPLSDQSHRLCRQISWEVHTVWMGYGR